MLRTTGLALIFCSLTYAGASAEPVQPASRESLAARIKQYQAAKDCDGMIGLFYTRGMDQERKAAFENTVRKTFCDNFGRPVIAVTFKPLEDDMLKAPRHFGGSSSQYTLKPEGAISVHYGKGVPMQTELISFLYGSHDHKTYLLTTKKADIH